MNARNEGLLLTIIITYVLMITIAVIGLITLNKMAEGIPQQCCKQNGGRWILLNISLVSITQPIPHFNFNQFCSVSIDECPLPDSHYVGGKK